MRSRKTQNFDTTTQNSKMSETGELQFKLRKIYEDKKEDE